jgi:hypothetical protein
MTNETPDVSARDALEIAQNALQQANDADQHDEIQALQDRVTALELRTSEWADDREYSSLTLDEKVGLVREHAFNKATDGTGRATLDYDDVMWEVFDGRPGTKHCYKLLRLAAQARGFEYTEASSPTQLRVDATEARRGAAFFPENKTASEGGRR